MATIPQKLMVEVVADSRALEQLSAKASTAFRSIEVSAKQSAAGIDAIANRITRLSAGAELEGTRAQSLKQLVAAEGQLQKALQAGNLTLDERIRIETQAARATAGIERATAGLVPALGAQRTAGLAAVEGFKAQGLAASVTRDRYAGAAIAIASAAETMSRTGKVGGQAARTLLTTVSSLAFAFGSGGVIVGSVAIAGQAILEFFTRARREIEETKQKAKAALDELQNRGDVTGLTARAQIIRQGTPANQFDDSLDLLEQKIAAKKAEIDTAIRQRNIFVLGALQQALQELEDKARPLQEEFADIVARVQQPGVQQRPERQAIKITAADPKALAEQQAATAKATRELSDAFNDLAERAAKGNVSLDDYDRAMRDLRQRFQDIKRPTTETTKAFADIEARSVGVRTQLTQLSADKAAEQFEKLRAALTTTAVDDMQLALADLKRELADNPFITDEQRQQLEDAEQSLIDTTAAIEDANKAIAKSKDIGIELPELQRQQADLADRLAALSGKGAEFDKERLTLETAIADLGQRIAKAKQDEVDAYFEGNQQAATLGQHLGDAAKAAFGIASALLGADDAITKVLGSVVQLVDGFREISSLAKSAGGLSQLFSTGGGIVSALPGLSQILGGGIALAGTIGGLFGKSPADVEHDRILKENNERLRDLRDGLVAAIQLTTTPAKTAAIRDLSLTQTRFDVGTLGGGQGRFVTGPITTSADLLAALHAAGIGLDDLKKAAQSFGVGLSNPPLVSEFKALQAAIKTFQLEQILKSWSGALKRLDIDIKAQPEAFTGWDGELKKVTATIAAATDAAAGGSSAIQQALSGLDLTTQAGRSEAITRLAGLVDNIGQLDLSQLGNLSPDEFLQAISDIIDGIHSLENAAQLAADAFSGSLDVFAVGVKYGVLSVDEATKKAVEAFTKDFPELAAQIDFSSRDAFRKSIKPIIEGMLADGILTEAEKAQLQAIGGLSDSFDAGAAAADELASHVNDAFNNIRTGFEVLGTSVSDQITQSLANFKLPEGFASLTEGLGSFNPLDPAARDELRKRLRADYAEIAKDGITAAEQPFADGITFILSLLDRADQEAADAAQRILSRSDLTIEFDHITDPIAKFAAKVDGFKAAFPAFAHLFDGIDLTTAAGVQQADDRIRRFFDDLRAGGFQLEGLTTEQIDALVAALGTLDTAAAEAANSLQSAADALSFGLHLENITDPIEKAVRTVQALGKVTPELAAVTAGADVTTAGGRAALEQQLIALGERTTDKTTQQAILQILDAIRAIPSAVSQGVTAAAGAGTEVLSGTPQLTAIQGDRLLDYQRTLVALTRQLVEFAKQDAGLPAAPAFAPIGLPRLTLGPVQPPALPSTTTAAIAMSVGRSGSVFAPQITTTLNVRFDGVPADARGAADKVSKELARQIRKAIAEINDDDLRTLGMTARA